MNLFAIYSSSVTKIHYKSIIVFAYSLSVPPIHNLFHTMNSQFWIRYLLSEITKDWISISKMYYEPIILSQFHHEFTISFEIMLWILYLVTKTLWIHYIFPELPINLRSVSNLRPSIHYHFNEFTVLLSFRDWLSLSRKH